MYLLMLLATFVSAIYGYNLSARPDYERDIALKRATAVVYKFVFHIKTVSELVGRISTYDRGTVGLMGFQPNDLIYSDFENEDNAGISLTYEQVSEGDKKVFLLRKKDRNNGDNPIYSPEGSGIEVEDWLLTGRFLINGEEMVTKVVCMNGVEMYDGGVQCHSTLLDGHLQDSCCDGNTERFLVSYRKFDPRFINRITQNINMDFWNAINEWSYLDNIGIIYWENNKWKFQGKLNFRPSYAKEQHDYEEEHKNDENKETRAFPAELRRKTYWELPLSVFDENFFSFPGGGSGEGGASDVESCKKSGCLFQIRYF